MRHIRFVTTTTAVLPVVAAVAFWALSSSVAGAQGYTDAVCGQGQGGISLTVQDGFIVMRGGICPGDEDTFRVFLKTADRSVRTIKLVSGGGNGAAAEKIGMLIRSGGYNTYVDGATDRCASSCTHIFASGVERFYSGAETIVTGTAARRGLGYHYLDAKHTGESDADKDRKFNATAVPFLKRMLPAPAANAAIMLMKANHTAQVTWLNGNEALHAGIATSLATPAIGK
jgi:hypothetical protein